MLPRLIIHGGAGKKPPAKRKKAMTKALDSIIKETYPVLLRDGAIKAVVHAITMLEDNPLFNAGTGSRLQADGKARLTASLMHSQNQKFSAVINIENVKNPVLIAHLLQEERFTVLAGREATAFARAKGFKPYNPVTEERRKEWQLHSRIEAGTVGAVALDAKGVIAAATSTGGVGSETPGRVSDVASPCGTYADKFVGVSCSGRGEEIVNVALAVRVAVRVAGGVGLKEAAESALKELDSHGGRAGIIAVDKEGHALCLCNTDFMAYAVT